METKGLFFGGKVHKAVDGGVMDVFNPADGTVLAKVAQAGSEDVSRAVTAAGAWLITGVSRFVARLPADLRPVPSHYVLSEFDDLQKSCDFLEILWFPSQDEMWLYMMDRTNDDPDEVCKLRRLWSRVAAFAKEKGGNLVLPALARRWPSCTPRLIAWINTFKGATLRVQEASDAFHFLKGYPRAWSMSYAVPAEHSKEAWQRVMHLVERYQEKGSYPVNLTVHCRFTEGRDFPLAPDTGGQTCWIEAVTIAKTKGWWPFMRELETCYYWRNLWPLQLE